MEAGDTTVVEGPGPRSDEAFQRLLLQFSSAASQGTQSASLVRLFCQATREFFQVDGAYFWQFTADEELVGTEADGLMADRRGNVNLVIERPAPGQAIYTLR